MVASMKVTVLRLGHRPQRDKRLSTHLLLTARAFGVKSVIYSGKEDPKMEDGIKRIVKEWGGNFTVEYTDNWRHIIGNWKGKITHLTMYGLPLQEMVDKIRENVEPMLVVVGGSKVPHDVYNKADWNVSITNQPHSEVSALAVFLHVIFRGQELSFDHEGARLVINPSERGKDVRVLSKD